MGDPPLLETPRLFTAGTWTRHQGLLAGLLLRGSGDLVSRLITPITHIVALDILIMNQLTKSP